MGGGNHGIEPSNRVAQQLCCQTARAPFQRLAFGVLLKVYVSTIIELENKTVLTGITVAFMDPAVALVESISSWYALGMFLIQG